MTYTQYKKLQMPLSTEKYNIEVFNNNAKIIDSELHKLEMKNQEQDGMFAGQNELNDHINAQNNPHHVTKNQIGLSNVDNTSDKDKPVSDPVDSFVRSLISEQVIKLSNDITDESNRAMNQENQINEIINENRAIWNDKYTKKEIDDKFAQLPSDNSFNIDPEPLQLVEDTFFAAYSYYANLPYEGTPYLLQLTIKRVSVAGNAITLETPTYVYQPLIKNVKHFCTFTLIYRYVTFAYISNVTISIEAKDEEIIIAYVGAQTLPFGRGTGTYDEDDYKYQDKLNFSFDAFLYKI